MTPSSKIGLIMPCLVLLAVGCDSARPRSGFEYGVCDQKVVNETKYREQSHKEPFQAYVRYRCSPHGYSTCGRWEIQFRTVKTNESYTEPRVIKECCDGFRFDTENDTCQPKCSPQCIHGTCKSPHFCTCDRGYVKNATNPWQCDPYCEDVCVNGFCSGPNACSCLDGFEDRAKVGMRTKCEPVCIHECFRGKCVAPDECACDEGYEKKPSHSPNYCGPVCEYGCTNGRCEFPNECVCDDGYTEDPDNAFNCIPKCADECTNATCTAPNTCTCDRGYKVTKDPNVCEIMCSEECKGGQCVDDEKCQCLEGYVRSDSPYVCDPVCSNCTNGNCTLPEICECHEGYVNQDDDSSCVPSCESCSNGTCVEPGMCRCDDSFEMNPLGECVERCREGTEMRAINDTWGCVPVCEGGCMQKYCTGDEGCLCNEGFTLVNDTKCFSKEELKQLEGALKKYQNVHSSVGMIALYVVICCSLVGTVGFISHKYIKRRRAFADFSLQNELQNELL